MVRTKVSVRPTAGLVGLLKDFEPTEENLDRLAQMGYATDLDPDACKRFDWIMCTRPDCEHCRSQDKMI